MRHLVSTVVVLALAACRAPEPPLDAPVVSLPAVVASASASALAPPVDAPSAAPRISTNATSPRARTLDTVAFVPDGTLVVIASDAFVAYSRDHEIARVAITPGEIAGVHPGPSVVLEGGDHVRLLALPSLRELYSGKARPLDDPRGNAAVLVEGGDGDTSVVILPAGASGVTVLAPLPEGKDVSVREVEVTASGRFAVVTVTATNQAGNEEEKAVSYDLASRRAIASVPPASRIGGELPLTTIEGDREVSFRGSDLVVVDLATGATLHRVPFHCGDDDAGYHPRGNPTLDPAVHRLIVTCADDGYLYDYPSLRRIRTYPRLMPGCDNGLYLGGVFSKDGSTLTLQGCGGESRLDVGTGRFVCGDNDGLMGQPYDMMPGQSHERPKQALGVPACNTVAEREQGLSRLSPHYRLEYDLVLTAVAGPHGVRVVLGEGVTSTAIAKDESRVAYIVGNHVVERALPSGKVLRTIEP